MQTLPAPTSGPVGRHPGAHRDAVRSAASSALADLDQVWRRGPVGQATLLVAVTHVTVTAGLVVAGLASVLA